MYMQLDAYNSKVHIKYGECTLEMKKCMWCINEMKHLQKSDINQVRILVYNQDKTFSNKVNHDVVYNQESTYW